MNGDPSRQILKERNQSHRIDVLRGIFALWVFVCHSFELAFSAGDQLLARGIAGRWVSTLFHSGYFGVTGFFFLSGFCIHWSITNTLAKAEEKNFPLFAYFRARFLRIAPLFYVGIALALVCNWLVINQFSRPDYIQTSAATLQQVGASLGFLQGIFGELPLYGPSWSITNEVIYYIVWPLVLIMAGFRSKRSFALAGMLAVLCTGLFYLLWRKFGDQNWIVMTALWGIPLSSIMWILGAACRRYYASIVSHRWFLFLQRWWWLVILLWMGWATTLLFLEVPLLFRLVLDPFGYLAIPLLVLSNWKAPVPRSWERWLADLSYPLYLFHIPLLVVSICALHTWQGADQQLAGTCAMTLTLAVCGTIGVTLEKKFLGLKAKSAR